MKIKFTCASEGEKAQTVTVGQLLEVFENTEYDNFYKGAKYRIYFTNGTSVEGYVNREGKTLYIPAANLPKGFKKATVGNPVSKTVKSLKFIKG
jgi:hypothetical protein